MSIQPSEKMAVIEGGGIICEVGGNAPHGSHMVEAPMTNYSHDSFGLKGNLATAP